MFNFKGHHAGSSIAAIAMAFTLVLGSGQYAGALPTKKPDDGKTKDVGIRGRQAEAVRKGDGDARPPATNESETGRSPISKTISSAEPSKPEGKGTTSKVSAGKPKYKVSYSTTCPVDMGGKGSCWTFDESPCPNNQPLKVRTIRTLSGQLVTRDTYCNNEPAPQLSEGSRAKPADIQRAVQEQRVIEVTPAQFQSFPILGSKLVSQPEGFSLRNGHAHMYAVPNPQTFEVDIFDEPVRIRATPRSYAWDYGDGASRSTQTPGKPVPGHTFDEPTETSHVYKETGDYAIGLSTSYSGEYSVDGGPWMPIPGTANVPSEPMQMSVWRTKKLLVDQTCSEDPNGPACDSPFLKEDSSAK